MDYLMISLIVTGLSLILNIVISLVLVKVLFHGDRVRNELINKLMAKDFDDYSRGTERIGLTIAAQENAARKREAKEMNDEFDDAEAENPDMVPVT
jgi:hypothetical protein